MIPIHDVAELVDVDDRLDPHGRMTWNDIARKYRAVRMARNLDHALEASNFRILFHVRGHLRRDIGIFTRRGLVVERQRRLVRNCFEFGLAGAYGTQEAAGKTVRLRRLISMSDCIPADAVR